MRIGLIDVDGHNFPNIALMKISAYEKGNGNNVEWVNFMNRYDRVYISKVFKFTPDINNYINANNIIKGGTGYNLKTKLSNEIENQYPDYKIYNTNIAYGHLTRGCPRNCNFCIVSEKEGLKSYKVSDLKNFWDGQKEIKLLDPNILAYKHHLKLLDQLINSNSWIDFTQGIDCRFLTIENIEKILACKIKMLHFAWDGQKDENIIIKKLEMFNNSSDLNFRKKRVYVLVNFDTPFEYDLYRIELLRKMDYDPYVMIYDKQNVELKYKRLARYVNNKFIFRVTNSFEEYTNIKNIKNKKLENQISIFN